MEYTPEQMQERLEDLWLELQEAHLDIPRFHRPLSSIDVDIIEHTGHIAREYILYLHECLKALREKD